jgi:hypothetical protein
MTYKSEQVLCWHLLMEEYSPDICYTKGPEQEHSSRHVQLLAYC